MTATPPPTTPDASAIVERIVQFYEQLQASDLDQLHTLYAADASFKDPFQSVQGLAAIRHIYEHMYQTLDTPHFLITERVIDTHQCFLIWNFRFRFKNFQPQTWQTIHGSTHLRWTPTGLITHHRDYWDAAEELYEKLPLIGPLLRWLKKWGQTPINPHA